jgi:hypothetical protein
MKHITLAFVLAALCGCRNEVPYTTAASKAISVAIDRSDPRILRCNAGPLLQLFNCVNQPDSEGWLHITGISDQQYNEDYTIHLLSAAITEQNAVEDVQSRKKYILSFYDSVEHVVQHFYKTFDTTDSNSKSEIFATVCRELEWLREKPAKQKILILLSDILENSELTNSYITATPKNVSSLVSAFEATGVLPDKLKGYTIFIVNVPKNASEDSKFSVMVTVFRHLFEVRGAKVIVQQNSQNFAL